MRSPRASFTSPSSTDVRASAIPERVVMTVPVTPRTFSPFTSLNATDDESLMADLTTVGLSTVHCRYVQHSNGHAPRSTYGIRGSRCATASLAMIARIQKAKAVKLRDFMI